MFDSIIVLFNQYLNFSKNNNEIYVGPFHVDYFVLRNHINTSKLIILLIVFTGVNRCKKPIALSIKRYLAGRASINVCNVLSIIRHRRDRGVHAQRERHCCQTY